MGNLSELKGVERPVTEWLSKMGWTFRSNVDLKVYERPFSKPIVEQILVEKTAKINGISEELAWRAVELLLQNLNNPIPILGNESFLDKLVSGVTLAIKDQDIDVHFIDFENIWENVKTILTRKMRSKLALTFWDFFVTNGKIGGICC